MFPSALENKQLPPKQAAAVNYARKSFTTLATALKFRQLVGTNINFACCAKNFLVSRVEIHHKILRTS